MRLHIELEDSLVEQIDRRAGARGRSLFIRRAISHALEQQQRWDEIESAIGTVREGGHPWDDDAAGWVRAQRRGDHRRLG